MNADRSLSKAVVAIRSDNSFEYFSRLHRPSCSSRVLIISLLLVHAVTARSKLCFAAVKSTSFSAALLLNFSAVIFSWNMSSSLAEILPTSTAGGGAAMGIDRALGAAVVVAKSRMLSIRAKFLGSEATDAAGVTALQVGHLIFFACKSASAHSLHRLCPQAVSRRGVKSASSNSFSQIPQNGANFRFDC